MITVERLDKIEQDLEWARENADRSAQTRLFIHHVPFLLTILRPVAEAIEAERLEEEEYLAEEEVDRQRSLGNVVTEESDPKVENKGTVVERLQGFLGGGTDSASDATDEQSTDGDQAEWEETSDALEDESDPDKADPEVNSPDEASEAVEETTE